MPTTPPGQLFDTDPNALLPSDPVDPDLPFLFLAEHISTVGAVTRWPYLVIPKPSLLTDVLQRLDLSFKWAASFLAEIGSCGSDAESLLLR
jgi:hypothetical protein